MSKEVRLNCDTDVTFDNVQVRGNISFKYKNKHYDRKIVKVIKKLGRYFE